MPFSAANIFRNFEQLTTGKEYYEQELFTKFEDAFLMETGPHKSGLDIIHQHRSMIKYTDGKGGKHLCELGDVRMILYSPRTGEIRLSFLQFKKADMLKTGAIQVKLSDSQYNLYEEHCLVEPVKKASFIYESILRTNPLSVSLEDDAGTLFAFLYEQGGTLKFEMANAKVLRPVLGRKVFAKARLYIVPRRGASSVVLTPYKYCDYISTFGELLFYIKRMQVGRKIDKHMLLKIVPTSVIPNALATMIDAIKENDDSAATPVPSTMFLNVDELSEA